MSNTDFNFSKKDSIENQKDRASQETCKLLIVGNQVVEIFGWILFLIFFQSKLLN